MRSRSTTARIFWLVAAVLQLVLPGALAWADARVQRETAQSPQPTSHIESHGTDQCPRTHPPDCALCRHLSTPIGLAAGHSPAPQSGVDAPVVAEGRYAPSALPFGLPRSRAPPLS